MKTTRNTLLTAIAAASVLSSDVTAQEAPDSTRITPAVATPQQTPLRTIYNSQSNRAWTVELLRDGRPQVFFADSLRGDTLYGFSDGGITALALDDIRRIRVSNGSNAGGGFLAGALIGGLFGYLAASSSTYSHDVIEDVFRPPITIASIGLGAAGGGLLGLIIGALVPGEDVVQVSGAGAQGRVGGIARIMR